MTQRVEILRKRRSFKRAIFEVYWARLQYERLNGTMSEPLERYSFERGDSVAAVIHNPATDKVLLAEQFRYPTFDKGPGWILELPAGVIKPDEHPTEAMRRELREELRYNAQYLYHVSTFYVSPGGSSERVLLFYVPTTDALKEQVTLESPQEEEIRTVSRSVTQILGDISRGNLQDAKTIIGLQWLHINREHLPGVAMAMSRT